MEADESLFELEIELSSEPVANSESECKGKLTVKVKRRIQSACAYITPNDVTTIVFCF